MDRGLKERLVGAAVLVAIGAWLIPWVLDGPQRIDATESTAIELPAPPLDAPPVRRETLVLDRRESPTAASLEAPAPAGSTAAVTATPPATAAPVAASPARQPEPRKAAADAETAAAPTGTQWYTQLGAFGDVGNADRLAARVATYGYEATVSASPGGGGTVHRVRIGPEETRARAEAIASALSAHGFVAQVVFE